MMMSPFEQLFNQTIDIFGIPASFQYAKTKKLISGINVGISTLGGADPDLINTVSVGQRVITVKSSDLDDTPSKFDVFVINGEKLTIDTMTNIYEPKSGKLLGYKNYARIA